MGGEGRVRWGGQGKGGKGWEGVGWYEGQEVMGWDKREGCGMECRGSEMGMGRDQSGMRGTIVRLGKAIPG